MLNSCSAARILRVGLLQQLAGIHADRAEADRPRGGLGVLHHEPSQQGDELGVGDEFRRHGNSRGPDQAGLRQEDDTVARSW